MTGITNPYWDAVADFVFNDFGDQVIGRYGIGVPGAPERQELVHLYSWTITDPDSVAFVAKYAGSGLIDPMAGSGYWAYLLGQLGVDVICYDLAPPGKNFWHHTAHVEIAEMDGAESVLLHPDRTLLLAWPQYNHDSGQRTLAAYPGHRVIFNGEGRGGCTGTDAMHDMIEGSWAEKDRHSPIQWLGVHDRITVYER